MRSPLSTHVRSENFMPTYLKRAQKDLLSPLSHLLPLPPLHLLPHLLPRLPPPPPHLLPGPLLPQLLPRLLRR